jgi:hypothetical protein
MTILNVVLMTYKNNIKIVLNACAVLSGIDIICNLCLGSKIALKNDNRGKPLVWYTPESVTITQSEEYRYGQRSIDMALVVVSTKWLMLSKLK